MACGIRRKASSTATSQPSESERIQKVGQLRKGVAKVVEDPRYTPEPGASTWWPT